MPCAEFLSRCPTGLWRRAKARILRAERCRYPTMAVYTETARRIQSAEFSEVFWAKLQLQIQHHLSHFHCYGRELTVDRLLCDIGIFHGHRHLNTSSISLLTLVYIPDRHYWHHWWKYWKYHTWRHCEPSERNVVLGILTFSLYVARVCGTCKQELGSQGYHIHPGRGVRRQS